MLGKKGDDVVNPGVVDLALFGLLERRSQVAILGEDVSTLLHEKPHDL